MRMQVKGNEMGKPRKKKEPRSAEELAKILRGVQDEIVNYLGDDAGESIDTMVKALEELEESGGKKDEKEESGDGGEDVDEDDFV